MATKIKLGTSGNWGVKPNGVLAYNDENNVFKAIELQSSRASGATRVNESGLIESVASGVPRIDWTNGVGELLLEPQSTNLIPYSEDFSQSVWIKSIANVTLTSEIAPNGTNDSVYNFVGADANLYTNTQSAGLDYTISFYVKSNGNGKDVFKLRLGGDFSQVFTATNEWVRYTFNATPSSQVFGISSNGIDSDILIWGAQLEALSYPTSYIRTNGTTETRIADAVTGNSSLGQVINSSEGVLYLEVSTKDTSVVPVITISDGTTTNVIEFAFFGTNQYNIIHRSSLGNTTYVSSVVDAETFNKFAFAYNNSTLKTYLNGVNVDSRAVSGALNGLDALKLSFVNNTLPFYGRIRELKVYDTALTDAQLQSLTTL